MLIWWIFCSEYSIHTPSDSVTSAPASLMQKNPQRGKIIFGMRLAGHEGRSIDLRMLL